MKLEELKELMGIAAENTKQDAVLKLYLASALKAAKTYANAYDWESTDELPDEIKLGILRYVELSQKRKASTGIVSKSMAGMSVTYASGNDKEYFGEVFSIWLPYRKKGVVFRSAKRKDNAIEYPIPDDITITGTRKL